MIFNRQVAEKPHQLSSKMCELVSSIRVTSIFISSRRGLIKVLQDQLECIWTNISTWTQILCQKEPAYNKPESSEWPSHSVHLWPHITIPKEDLIDVSISVKMTRTSHAGWILKRFYRDQMTIKSFIRLPTRCNKTSFKRSYRAQKKLNVKSNERYIQWTLYPIWLL